MILSGIKNGLIVFAVISTFFAASGLATYITGQS